ncbi:MAG: hypothetical protein HHJ11_07450 [Phycicoccus sp.]|nr:hypothetical protein [Phycicoccus sp.]
MTRTLDDLRGALHAEADAAAYPDVDVLVSGARRRVAETRRRRLAVLGAFTAAVMVVGGVAMTRPAHQALPQPAGQGASSPATIPTASSATSLATIPTASPTASLPASQSAADARAYGIESAVAALPIGVRVFQPDPAVWPVATTQASTPEGLWVVSRAERSPDFDYNAHSGLLTEYGELLLLTPDRSRILRAYPFRGVPPQWLLVTQDAIYCGRQGDGGLPNSMVCRVDRSTGALTVVVFPTPDVNDPTGTLTVAEGLSAPQALAGRPGSWRLAGFLPSADLQHVPQLTAGGLVFAPDPNQAGGGKALRLDPVTLK